MARNSDVELKALVARIAKAKGIPEDKMGKQVRTRIRSAIDANILVPTKHWPAYAKQGKANRDGNRYPALPSDLADALFTSMTKGKALKDTLAKPKRTRTPKPDAAPRTNPVVTELGSPDA